MTVATSLREVPAASAAANPAAPAGSGLDKFSLLLVNGDQDLAPLVTQILPVSPRTFMLAVGVIEIAAGVLVAMRPQVGASVVALWLWGIIVNLLLVPGSYDIALRDFGLSLGALVLARLRSRPALIVVVAPSSLVRGQAASIP